MFDVSTKIIKKSEEIKIKVKKRFEKVETEKVSSIRKPKSGKGI